MKIVITDAIDIPEADIMRLKQLGAAVYNDIPEPPTIIQRIKDAEIITANYIDISPDIIDAAPNLKYIVVPAVGSEWVDKKYAASKDITTLNCPTHNARAVAEHAVALMFSVQRKLFNANAALKVGQWDPKLYKGKEMSSSKIGIIGSGHIGGIVATLCASLGAKVTSLNSRSSEGEWKRVLAESDIVCSCLPLNDATRHIMNADKFAVMKKGSVFVNVGRGATVDTHALTTALCNGTLSGAGIDVFEDEPLTGAPSQSIVDLANLSNVVATPHMAYNTEESSARLGEELVADIESCIAGNPINVVG